MFNLFIDYIEDKAPALKKELGPSMDVLETNEHSQGKEACKYFITSHCLNYKFKKYHLEPELDSLIPMKKYAKYLRVLNVFVEDVDQMNVRLIVPDFVSYLCKKADMLSTSNESTINWSL